MKRIIIGSILIIFGTLISFPSPIENPESEAQDFDTLDTMRTDSAAESIEEDELVLYLEDVQETITRLGVEQIINGNNTTEPSGHHNTEKKSDTEKKDAQQEQIKVRTKLKCVESILKNAVIQPYYINGQIEGLQLDGLDKISEAKALLLKSGDIILAVNGQTLSSKKEAYDIFKKARKYSIIIVDLLQDGKAKKLLFDFKGAV